MANFDATLLHLNGLLQSYQSPAVLEALATDLAEKLYELAPKRSGNMAEVITEIGHVVEERPFVHSIGVGNKDLLGDPYESTKDTLLDFYTTPGWGDHFKPTSQWRHMGYEAQAVLEAGRAEGLFGGPSYTPGSPARYYYAQSGEGDWEVSSMLAHITPTYFTSEAIEDWGGGVHGIIQEALGA